MREQVIAAKARADACSATLAQILLELDAVAEPLAEVAAPPVTVGLQNPAAFYDHIRGEAGELWPTMTPTQHSGCEAVLAACAGQMPLSWAAYALATTYHETAYTMEPVREAYWLSEEWRKANLRYYPWYGRGYVQLTWEKNYKRADQELGLNGLLTADPDNAMTPEIAADILVKGMKGGWFTGKRLNDYIPAVASVRHYKNARRVINGTDKDDKIAGYAIEFDKALRLGGWR